MLQGVPAANQDILCTTSGAMWHAQMAATNHPQLLVLTVFRLVLHAPLQVKMSFIFYLEIIDISNSSSCLFDVYQLKISLINFLRNDLPSWHLYQ